MSDVETAAGPQEPLRPLLRVVRGAPSAEELAALLAVLTARASRPPDTSTSVSPWVERSRYLRRPLSPGPGGWRSSALPG